MSGIHVIYGELTRPQAMRQQSGLLHTSLFLQLSPCAVLQSFAAYQASW